MNLKAYGVAGILSIILLFPAPAQAMAFLDFAKMNNDDEATYVSLLIEGAAKMLQMHGQPDQARKTLELFKDTGPHSGVKQLALQMKRLNAINDRNAINPNNRAPVYQVEDAMALTLKDNGIIVPVSYLLTVNQNFVPVGPSRGILNGP